MKQKARLITYLLAVATLVSIGLQSASLTLPRRGRTTPAAPTAVSLLPKLVLPPDASTPPLQPASSPPSANIATPSLSSESLAPTTTTPPTPPPSHPNYRYTALIANNNPLYPTEPFLGRISAPAGVSSITSASSGAPIIAVIDTGFALNHSNFTARWATDPTEMGATNVGSAQSCTAQGMSLDKRCNNYDNNNDGYSSNWRGWNFVNNDNNPMAGRINPNGQSVTHGTLTASLAAIFSPNTKIMPLQALDDNGVGYTDTVAAAVKYAADHGANVISLSLGSVYDDSYLRSQIDYAIAKGIVVVAAAGNSGCNCLSYPAAYPEVLSVGASDASDNLAGFSSYGPNLDVVAPGTAGDVCGAVWTAANQTSLYSCGYSGTSFATPLVASLAALLQTQDPPASPSDIVRFITQNTDKVAGMNGASRTLQYGYGRINVNKAVLAASLATPQGQLLSKTTASLSANDLTNGPLLDSTCQGDPGATCTVRATNLSSGTVIIIGTQTLDDSGGANFVWSAASLGLAPGTWQVDAVVTELGQTTVKPAVNLTISP